MARTTASLPERSASWLAMGVPTSSGMAETATDAVVAVATSPRAVLFWLSSVSLTLVYVSGAEKCVATGNAETSASTASTTVTITRARLLIQLGPGPI